MKKTIITCCAMISAIAMAEQPIKIRIGWQIPWATQGQIVQILKHTDILKKHGISAEFIGRTYGPVLNELAMAKSIDVVLTADQPAAALFSKGKGWIGIGRLMYNRALTYVHPKSKFNKISDLKGKTIGIPIGAAAERVTNEALVRAGLDPKKDVKIINLGIREQGPLVITGKNKSKWDSIDALSGFDPTPAIFESKKLIKVLDIGKVCSIILMNKEFIKKHKGVGKKIVQAVYDAYDYYRQNKKQANKWFMAEAKLRNSDQKSCDIAASIEPNVWVKSRKNIRVSFNKDDFKIMQRGADFLISKIKTRVDMKKFVTNEYAKHAK